MRYVVVMKLGSSKNDHELKEYILENFLYDRDNGCVERKTSYGKRVVNVKQSSNDLDFTIKTICIPKPYVVWLLVHGDWPDGQLALINKKRINHKADYRIENLMIINLDECKKMFKSVTQAKQKWKLESGKLRTEGM